MRHRLSRTVLCILMTVALSFQFPVVALGAEPLAAGSASAISTQSSGAVAFAPRIYEDYVWGSQAAHMLYYVARDDSGYYAGSYNADTGDFKRVASLGASTCYWPMGNQLYYLSKETWESNAYAIEVSMVDLTDGSAKVVLSGKTVSFFPHSIGVDGTGNIYVSSLYGNIHVYGPTGTDVATIDENLQIERFCGFDDTNGNFYYQSTCNWRYWGYDHLMDCLKVGNLKDGAITYNDSEITLFNQRGYRIHYGYAQMLGSRYLADLSPFNDDMLYLVDSNAVGVNDVGSISTTLYLTGGMSVTGVALPAADVKMAAETRSGAYSGGTDIGSVGVRAAYHAATDRLYVATSEREVTCYSVAANEALATVALAYDAYAVQMAGDKLVVVEKASDGTYYVEALSTAFPTSITLSGASSMTVGSGGQYQAKTDGDIHPFVTYSTSDASVASIDQSGYVSAWKEGTATITAKTQNGLAKSMTVKVTPRAKAAPSSVAELSGAKQSNLNGNAYTTYGNVVASYLVGTGSGVMRVQARASDVLVERYGATGALESTLTVAMPLPYFGGFYAGSNAYYLVFGQANSDESDDATVMRVVKYDTSWKELGSVDVKGANTVSPFDAGSLRMVETGGFLYIHTCHTMYASSDGLNHQANMTYKVDEASMTVVDSYYEVMNLSTGYVSHSFNQFVRTDGTRVYRVDHGDGYPRGIAFTATPVSGKLGSPTATATVAEFNLESSGNYTGASVGGFELSRSHALIAWNEDGADYSNRRNVKLTAIDLTSGLVETLQLTNYSSDDGVTCYTPQLAKVDDSHFLLMWTEQNTATGDLVTKIAQVDQQGLQVSPAVAKKVPLSDCQPVTLADGSVAWFVSGETFLKLYKLDPYNLQAMADDVMQDDPAALNSNTDGAGSGDTASSDTAGSSSSGGYADDSTVSGTDALAGGIVASSAPVVSKGGSSVASVSAAIVGAKNDKDPAGSSYAALQLKAAPSGKKAVKLTWKKVKGASGYIVYGAKCGTAMKQLGRTSGKSFTNGKLKKGTYYKYVVVAVKGSSVVGISKMVHVATKGGKVGNAKRVKTAAKKAKLSLSKGKKFKLKAKAVAQSKKLKVKAHRAVSYESTNGKVATVSKKGVVKAKKKGTCYVYAYAQNGVCAKVKVVVR